MEFGVETGIFLAYSACLLSICFFGRLLMIPVKIILKVLLNSLMGAIVLAVVKILCINFDISIPLNPLTAVIVGVLGVPGIVGIIIVSAIAYLI